ncbi:MAG: NADH-ubiquinone/plastoquinone oxidoreductase chain [Pseudomonadota bacterium]|jgi:multicomponent Na+:H+ antiporter subunit C
MIFIKKNMLQNIVFLSLSQSSLILLFVSYAFDAGNNIAPFYVNNKPQGIIYADPLVQAMMLTAIVVGFATTALGIGIIVKINSITIESEEF